MNQSYVVAVEFGADDAILPASRANISKVFNSMGAYTPITRAPNGCLAWLYSGRDTFTFELSKIVQIHYIQIKMYATNIRHLWLDGKGSLTVTATFNEYFDEGCRLARAHHLDEDLAVNDKYLTLEFACDDTTVNTGSTYGRLYDRILFKVKIQKDKFSQVAVFHVCDLRIYRFDHSCGQPDHPLTMDVLNVSSISQVYDYRCKDNDHYLLDGKSRIECSGYGQWIQEFPHCIPRSYCRKLTNDTVGSTVDINYDRTLRASSGQSYIPSSMGANLSCHTINNKIQTNQTLFVLRGPQRVDCLDGHWTGLLPDNEKHDCVVELMRATDADSATISVPQYIIFVLSGVLLLSLVVIVCLTGYTINSRRKRRQLDELKKARESIYENPYDETYHDFYDDTGIQTKDNGKGDGTTGDDHYSKIYDLPLEESHVYENSDDMVYQRAPGGRPNISTLPNNICILNPATNGNLTIDNIKTGPVVTNVKLNNGIEIPVIGFGTWQAEGPKLIQAIKDGLKHGFRHLDTSWFFHNERDIAQALQEAYGEGIVTREDLFIVYKIWPKNSNYKRTQNVIKNALRELNTTYLDFVSIQWPLKNNSDIYRALEWAYEVGLARSIGVSNFKPSEIDDLMITAKIKPAINHIRIHPGLNQDETIDYCHKNDIAVGGWSPLGTGSLVADPTLIAIGQKYNKTAAQVMIRWQIQRGLIVVPKSTKLSRIVENYSVFDFELHKDDMQAIHDMPQIVLIDFWG